MNQEKWMKEALKYIESNVQAGQKFECKDLYPAHTWNQLGDGERRYFGKYFANEVKEGRVPNVERINRAKNNHSRYQKI